MGSCCLISRPSLTLMTRNRKTCTAMSNCRPVSDHSSRRVSIYHVPQNCHTKNNLNLRGLQEGLKSLEGLVDLGHGVQMQASVQDASQITINVGLGFWAVCTLDEAPQIIAVRSRHCKEQLASLDNDMARVRAHIKLVQEGLEHLSAG